MRFTAWRVFAATAYIAAYAPTAEAQTVDRSAALLPPVTVTAPDRAASRKPPKPSRRAHSGAPTGRHSIPVPDQPLVAGNGIPTSSADPRLAASNPTAASMEQISGEEINARPFSRPGEALEAAAGLIVTQHSGEGKANQYFLRGFNLDHGTDLAITLDGMPINMPTHGHGQGYADINFVIPELIQSLEVRKGPYYADKGDFASAGAVDINYFSAMPKNLAELSFGSFGYQRAMATGSTRAGEGTLLAAFEANKYNGPWQVADDIRKLNGLLRYSQGTASDGFALTAMAYSNGWNSTDQVPQRAIDSSLINRFGSLDPSDGGMASRFSLSGNWAQSSDFGQTWSRAYVIRSSLQLYNDFTYLLVDPIKGDQFSQTDKRTVYGFEGSHAFDVRIAGIDSKTRIGMQTRYDDIDVGLFRTAQRQILSTVRNDHVQEGSVSLWADHTTRWNDWLRTTLGIREDYFAGQVESDTPQNSGRAQAAMTSPKAGIVLGPWYGTELFGNTGLGLHSNDLRGATTTVDPNDKVTPLDRVPLLVRSRGAEIGVRTRAFDGLTSSLAIFMLDFDSELLFVGDAGTTEPSRPSRRVGVEWTNQYRFLPGISLDLDLAYTHARFRDFDAAGKFIPGAPAWIASGGVTIGRDTGWFGSLRARYFGPRPLIEDDSVRSLSSFIVNARAGYQFHQGIRLQLDVLNLFNTQTNQIEYYYLSRLPGEPLGGVLDRHVHPAEPTAIRLSLAGQF